MVDTAADFAAPLAATSHVDDHWTKKQRRSDSCLERTMISESWRNREDDRFSRSCKGVGCDRRGADKMRLCAEKCLSLLGLHVARYLQFLDQDTKLATRLAYTHHRPHARKAYWVELRRSLKEVSFVIEALESLLYGRTTMESGDATMEPYHHADETVGDASSATVGLRASSYRPSSSSSFYNVPATGCPEGSRAWPTGLTRLRLAPALKDQRGANNYVSTSALSALKGTTGGAATDRKKAVAFCDVVLIDGDDQADGSSARSLRGAEALQKCVGMCLAGTTDEGCCACNGGAEVLEALQRLRELYMRKAVAVGGLEDSTWKRRQRSMCKTESDGQAAKQGALLRREQAGRECPELTDGASAVEQKKEGHDKVHDEEEEEEDCGEPVELVDGTWRCAREDCGPVPPDPVAEPMFAGGGSAAVGPPCLLVEEDALSEVTTSDTVLLTGQRMALLNHTPSGPSARGGGSGGVRQASAEPSPSPAAPSALTKSGANTASCTLLHPTSPATTAERNSSAVLRSLLLDLVTGQQPKEAAPGLCRREEERTSSLARRTSLVEQSAAMERRGDDAAEVKGSLVFSFLEVVSGRFCRLLQCACRSLLSCGERLSRLLAQGFFVPLCMGLIVLLSRLHYVCKCLIDVFHRLRSTVAVVLQSCDSCSLADISSPSFADLPQTAFGTHFHRKNHQTAPTVEVRSSALQNLPPSSFSVLPPSHPTSRRKINHRSNSEDSICTTRPKKSLISRRTRSSPSVSTESSRNRCGASCQADNKASLPERQKSVPAQEGSLVGKNHSLSEKELFLADLAKAAQPQNAHKDAGACSELLPPHLPPRVCAYAADPSTTRHAACLPSAHNSFTRKALSWFSKRVFKRRKFLFKR